MYLIVESICTNIVLFIYLFIPQKQGQRDSICGGQYAWQEDKAHKFQYLLVASGIF